MAVYTVVDADALDTFLSTYDLGAVIAFEGIAQGIENSNYKLDTERGRYILTLFEKRVKRQDLPFFVALMGWLADRGVPCPRPVCRRDGTALGRLAGRQALIVTFLEGQWLRQPTPRDCLVVGSAMARLHRSAAGFPYERPNDLALSGWRRLLAACRRRPEVVNAELGSELDDELHALAMAWPKTLPLGTIHGDLFPDNVFFLGGQVTGIIDFYFACTEILVYDVAIALNAWCFAADGAFRIEQAHAFLSGYQAVRPLSPAEINALPVLCRGAALRFLLTRLLDWADTPSTALVTRKDPGEYLSRLRVHRQMRDGRDYGVESP